MHEHIYLNQAKSKVNSNLGALYSMCGVSRSFKKYFCKYIPCPTYDTFQF